VLIATGAPVENALATASNARGLAVPDTRMQRTWLQHQAQRFAAVGSTVRDKDATGV
jgi:hypothetical protein